MSASDFSTTRCACCDEVGHSTRRCPELKPPALDFDKGQRIPDDGCEATLAHRFTVSDDGCEATLAHRFTVSDEGDDAKAKAKTQVINIYITPLKNRRPAKRARASI